MSSRLADSFRRIPSIVAVAFVLAVATAGCKRKAAVESVPPSDPRIVGSWTLTGGDYPLTDEYRADGTLVQHVGNRTTEPAPYRIEGEQIIVSLAQPDGRVTETKNRFTLAGDTLTLFDSPTIKRTF